MDIAIRINGTTPVLSVSIFTQKCEAEILAWLAAHGQEGMHCIALHCIGLHWIELDDAFKDFKLNIDRVIVCKSNTRRNEFSEQDIRTAL